MKDDRTTTGAGTGNEEPALTQRNSSTVRDEEELEKLSEQSQSDEDTSFDDSNIEKLDEETQRFVD
jgi:hypothetical protein